MSRRSLEWLYRIDHVPQPAHSKLKAAIDFLQPAENCCSPFQQAFTRVCACLSWRCLSNVQLMH